MNGFPPKELDLRIDKNITDVSIRSGDTLIVEENKEGPKIISSNTAAVKLQPKLVRK